MADKEHSSLEEAALAFYYHAAKMIKEGKSRKDIIKDLTSKGVSQKTAENMLDKLDQSRVNVAKRSGYRNAFVGVVIIIMMILPLFGIGIAKVVGTSFTIAIILLGCGIFALGRGIMQITGL